MFCKKNCKEKKKWVYNYLNVKCYHWFYGSIIIHTFPEMTVLWTQLRYYCGHFTISPCFCHGDQCSGNVLCSSVSSRRHRSDQYAWLGFASTVRSRHWCTVESLKSLTFHRRRGKSIDKKNKGSIMKTPMTSWCVSMGWVLNVLVCVCEVVGGASYARTRVCVCVCVFWRESGREGLRRV